MQRKSLPRSKGLLCIASIVVALLAARFCVFGSNTAYALSDNATWPAADGWEIQSGKLLLDISHNDLGYVMARVAEPNGNRFKMRVTYLGEQLLYDLDGWGEYAVIPLQYGSGDYTFSLYENVIAKKYSAEGELYIYAELWDENAAFIVPNQYVNYNWYTAAVAKSDELCAGLSTFDAYVKIQQFMTNEFVYDFIRSYQIDAGQLPDIDYCFENRMGICQDLAAVMCCMLRVQDIPSKLVIGYADKIYHAWTSTIVDGNELFFDPTAAVGGQGNVKKYTTERVY